MPSNLYPTSVELSDEQIAKTTEFYKEAYKSIVLEINSATNFGVENRKAILAQIGKILEALGVDLAKFLSDELTSQYTVGAHYAVKQLKNVDAQIAVATGFNRIHKEAIRFLIDDATRSLFEAVSGVQRSADLLLGKATRELITQKIGEGVVSGKALKEVRQTIKGILAEQGLDALTDKGGRGWSLDRYSEMLFRTKAVEARNHGFANRLVENGYDLVQVSKHSGSCKLCSPWEGKILSITGKTAGYPTLAEAEREGLFHPNCRHAINALIPSLASKTEAYNSEE